MSYTKGPWEAQETRVYFPNCWGGFDLRECPDAEANAHLIAAAPELFEVLSQIMSDLPSRRDWLDPVLEQRAKDAIAKATAKGKRGGSTNEPE